MARQRRRLQHFCPSALLRSWPHLILSPVYVDAFAGYGESMIDYNWDQNTMGIGITLNDLLDRP